MKLFTVWIALPLLIWSIPLLAIAQDEVTITKIDGEQMTIRLDSIADGVLIGGDMKINLDDLMMIQTGRSVVPERAAILVNLSGGGDLGVTGVTFNGEQFFLATESGHLTVPPDSIKGILIDQQADLSRFNRALENRSVAKDTVIAKTPDGQGLVRGIIESITDAKVIMNHDGRSRPISLKRVVGIVPADLKPEKPDGQAGTVKMVDGSAVTGAIRKLESGQLTVTLPGNASIELPMKNISSISLQSERVVYLSDLEPVDYSHNTLATLEFGWQRDLSVRRNPMRLFSFETGKTTGYTKGIGTHSACRLEFENAAGFNRFSAIVGIDAETEGKGDCQVSVWADGIKLWEGEVAGNSDPLKVNVDITRMKRVSLVVRTGRHLDLGDHVDWADARFLKIKD